MPTGRQKLLSRCTDFEPYMILQPKHIGVWLDYLDVNCLVKEDQGRLASFDIDDDSDLKALIVEWLKPNYEANNEKTRASMVRVLEQSKQWSAKQLEPAFAQVAFPSGKEFRKIDLFMRLLRAEILS
jgi:hypothetical protein